MSGSQELVSLSGESTKHLLSIASNILNANQNSLSSLSVQYIGYFYHVFPLHLNTYRRLFESVINPKLVQLKSCINEFISLSSNISSLRKFFVDHKHLIYFSNTYTTLLSSLSYNFPIFIEPYINNLFSDIDHDIQQLYKLSNFLSGFDQNLILLESKIPTISKFIDHVPYQHNHKYHHIIYPLYNEIKSSLNLVVVSFNNFKTSYIEKFIPNIMSNINQLTSFQPKLIDSKSKIKYMPSIDEINKFKDHLYTIISDKQSNSNIKSIENLLKHMKTINSLSQVSNGLGTLKSTITREKNNLHQYINKVKYWQSLLPGQISEEYRLRKIFQEREHLFPLYKEVIGRIDKEILSKKQLMEYSREIEKFLSERSDNVESIISSIDDLKRTIDISNSEIKNVKFKFYDPSIIKDIFSKIQLIEIITRALDTSRISLQNLEIDKKITQLNEYIKSMKNTLRWIEFVIQRLCYINKDILNIQSMKINVNLIKQQIIYIKHNIDTMFRILDNLKRVEITEDKIDCIISTLNSIRVHFKNFKLGRFELHLNKISNELEILKIYVKLFKKLYFSFLNFKYEVESKLKCLESSVSELECAIEGVPRNFIRCSIQSTNNIKVINSNDKI